MVPVVTSIRYCSHGLCHRIDAIMVLLLAAVGQATPYQLIRDQACQLAKSPQQR